MLLTGGRLTLEDAYAYSKFARAVLGTDSIDFRNRATSHEEADLLRSVVAGSGLGVTYADVASAPAVLLVALEVEEESANLFLRLRAAVRKGATQVLTLAPFASPGAAKLHARVLAAAPGQEPAVLATIGGDEVTGEGAASLPPGSVILVGERAAQSPGTIDAARELAERTGSRLAWVPRRAGERGALEAGALPGLLPWGRPLSDPQARAQVAQAWAIDADDLPTEVGLDLAGFVSTVLAEAAAAAHAHIDEVPTRTIDAVILAGVDLADAPDPAALRAALSEVPFVLSLETRQHRDHRPRRCRAPGRGRHREVRHLRELGGPRPAVPAGHRRLDDDHRRSCPRPGRPGHGQTAGLDRGPPPAQGARRAGPVAGATSQCRRCR